MKIEDEVNKIKAENELLENVSELAEALTPISDIALILRLDQFDLRQKIQDRSTALSEAYHRGKARGLLAVRRATIKKAESGDVPATLAVQRFHSLMNDDENI